MLLNEHIINIINACTYHPYQNFEITKYTLNNVKCTLFLVERNHFHHFIYVTILSIIHFGITKVAKMSDT